MAEVRGSNPLGSTGSYEGADPVPTSATASALTDIRSDLDTRLRLIRQRSECLFGALYTALCVRGCGKLKHRRGGGLHSKEVVDCVGEVQLPDLLHPQLVDVEVLAHLRAQNSVARVDVSGGYSLSFRAYLRVAGS
jgi:hypothetical protein